MIDTTGVLDPHRKRAPALGSRSHGHSSLDGLLGGLGVLAILVGAAFGSSAAFAKEMDDAVDDRVMAALLDEGVAPAALRRAAPRLVLDRRDTVIVGRLEWRDGDGVLQSTGDAEAVVFDQPDEEMARRAAIDVLVLGLASVAAKEISR